MNTHAIKVIYKYEMLRAWETLLQSFASPVISTALYFVVFGSAIGSRIQQIDGVPYGTFIVGAAATKSFIIGLIILGTAGFFVPFEVAHPFWMMGFLILTCITFSLFGFIIGLWADNFEKLQLIPLLVITPLVFLGGSFYSVDMLPPAGVPGCMPAHCVVDVQNGISFEAVDCIVETVTCSGRSFRPAC